MTAIQRRINMLEKLEICEHTATVLDRGTVIQGHITFKCECGTLVHVLDGQSKHCPTCSEKYGYITEWFSC